MTRQPFAHQDASGAAGAPLAVFVDDRYHSLVNTATDPYGNDTATFIAASHGHSVRVEVLTTCINHPTTAAVDCVICDPED